MNLNDIYFKKDLYNETVSYFLKYLNSFLKKLEKSSTADISSTKLLRDTKIELVSYITDKLLKSNLSNLSNTKKDEASKYFTNILRLIKYNLIYIPNLKLAVNSFEIIDNIDEIKDKLIVKKQQSFKADVSLEHSF